MMICGPFFVAAKHILVLIMNYAYDYFDNGKPIPELGRDLYWNLAEDVERFGNPFRTGGPNSFFDWLNTESGVPPEFQPTE